MAAFVSVAICIGAAVLEAVCAGTNVKAVLTGFRQPRFSAPLWVWSIIGALYYVIFGFVIYRLWRAEPGVSPALILIVAMMTANSLSNYVIFRARNLRANFVIGAMFPIPDVLLFAILLRIDSTAAVALVPYLVYRAYGVWWCYALWKANLSE